MGELKAWCNGYEVVAAETEAQATEVLRATKMYDGDEEALEGDGWAVLPNEKMLINEDRTVADESVGDVLAESPEPRHLWSCEV